MSIPQFSEITQTMGPIQGKEGQPSKLIYSPKQSRKAWFEPDAPAKLPPFKFDRHGARLYSEIKAVCRSCTGWDKAVIRKCVQTGCPMWELRPYQSKKITRK